MPSDAAPPDPELPSVELARAYEAADAIWEAHQVEACAYCEATAVARPCEPWVNQREAAVAWQAELSRCGLDPGADDTAARLVVAYAEHQRALEAENARLRIALNACGGFLSSLRDADDQDVHDYDRAAAERLCLRIAEALK